ncbi:MAG: zinc-binding dehydrogenase [Spirochaetes bacterium]|nr:zinc-binding dehydrogenase [Spirochaetota bacterium]
MRAERIVFKDKMQCDVDSYDAVVRDPMDVLVETVCSLVSAGTELAMYTKIHPHFSDPANTWAKYPFFPGYSSVGVVRETGSGVTDLAAGDMIYFWGKHATYQVVNTKSSRMIKIPANAAYEPFVFYHMAEIALTASWQVPAAFGKSVLVAGMGVIGNLAAQIYMLSGASQVYACDIVPRRLEQAKACGLVNGVNTAGRPFTDALKEIGVSGVDIAVEAIGANPVIRECLKAVRKNGSAVLLGSPRTPMEVDMYSDIHCKGLHLVGAHEASLTPDEKRRVEPYLITLLANDLLRTGPLITHRCELTDAPAVYDGLLNKKDEFTGVLFTYGKKLAA